MARPSESQLEIIEQEENIVKTVVESLRKQQQEEIVRLESESARSRELTSNLVAAKRIEDKAMMASDEAVSHVLRDKKQLGVAHLKKLVEKPYFGRVVLQEGGGEIEYKIGFAANPENRIIDWRKAPISRLYYEYREGEEYAEEILGKERTGTIALRRALDVERSTLVRISCPQGNLVKRDDEWLLSGENEALVGHTATLRLPNVLALVTEEQFRLITEDAKAAILIQGVAGSGKTTVALYRLAWLLHNENSDLIPKDCRIITRSLALKTYIEDTLPSMGIYDVKIETFQDWCREILKNNAPHLFNGSGNPNRPSTPCSPSVQRVYRSLALLKALDASIRPGDEISAENALLGALSRPERILQHDESHLISKELVKESLDRTLSNIQNHCSDDAALGALTRAVQIKSGEDFPFYNHLVLDEIQDFSALELAVVVNAVRTSYGLTLVGDASQAVNNSSRFPGWDRLIQYMGKEQAPKYYSLTISHRSTLPIIRLADYIQRRELSTKGRNGRVPIWFRCKSEGEAIQSLISWLTKANELYSGTLSAVLCNDASSAKMLLSLLRPSFGEAVRLGDESDFCFEAGIVITTVTTSKGLEFTNLVIWNPSESAYPSNDDFARNMLYIAVTRACENLCICSWKNPTRLLPGAGSKLLRVVEQD